MSKAERESDCDRFERWLTPYGDGELDAVHIIELEEHLEVCELCYEKVALSRALRTSLRETAGARAPASLRQRVLEAMEAELAEEPGDRWSAPPPTEAPMMIHERPQLVRMRYVFPLAAAALLLLLVGAMRYQQEGGMRLALKPHSWSRIIPTLPSDQQSPVLAAVEPLDELVEDLVSQHAEPLPPETTDPQSLGRFDRYVGVRVPRPEFKSFGGQYLGARVHPVRGDQLGRTAMLQYMLRNRHRVTLYVFDPQRVPMRANHLERRRVGKRKIYVGSMRGYSVAASERNGIGYALASDLSGDESAKLVLVASR